MSDLARDLYELRVLYDKAAVRNAQLCTGASGKSLGLTGTIYIRCIYGNLAGNHQIYGHVQCIHTRFWPTLVICTAKYRCKGKAAKICTVIYSEITLLSLLTLVMGTAKQRCDRVELQRHVRRKAECDAFFFFWSSGMSHYMQPRSCLHFGALNKRKCCNSVVCWVRIPKQNSSMPGTRLQRAGV